jgi:hypothetical protein
MYCHIFATAFLKCFFVNKAIVYQFHNGCVNRDKRHQFKFRLAFDVFFDGQKIASFSAESITKNLPVGKKPNE